MRGPRTGATVAAGEGGSDAVGVGNGDLSLLEASARVLDGVSRALSALDAGTYGRCESCGGEIGEPEMEADPIASVCAACAAGDTRGASG